MNWEIQYCLIRLETQAYGRASQRTASSDKYSVEQHIYELESANKLLRLQVDAMLKAREERS